MKTSGNMAPEDYEIAQRLCETDPEFKKLWDEHQELKEKLAELNTKLSLTTEEEMEMKRIKRIKLRGKDKIAMKIREYRVSSPG